MLNVFPIQFLSLFAYTILRIFVGIILVYLGLRHLRTRHELKEVFTLPYFPYGLFFVWYLGIVELVVGTMFLFGFLTQIAAILSSLIALKFLIMHRRFSAPGIPGRIFYALLLGASISLFITGSGALGFDLPI